MNEFFHSLFDHPLTALSAVLGFFSYMVIIAYYSGKWPFLGIKLNSRTKKSKRLIIFGYSLAAISLIMLSLVLPYYNHVDEPVLQVENPFLGDWTVVESTIDGVENRSNLRVFVSDRNTLQGNLVERRGKKYGFLRNNVLDHYNYLEIEGDLSTYSGLKLDHRAIISADQSELVINCFTKAGQDFGYVKCKRR